MTKIYHVANPYSTTNEIERQRLNRAWDTWRNLYATGALIPCHYFAKERRTAKTELGDERSVPFIRDMIDFGFEEGADVVVLTNADSAMVRETGDVLRVFFGSSGPVGVGLAGYSHRRNADKMHRYWLSYADAMMRCTPFVGVDLVAVSRSWWTGPGADYPDMVMGYEAWDWVFKFGIGDLGKLPDLIYHENHGLAYWALHKTAPGQNWNRQLAWKWASGRSDYDAIKRKWPSMREYERLYGRTSTAKGQIEEILHHATERENPTTVKGVPIQERPPTDESPSQERR